MWIAGGLMIFVEVICWDGEAILGRIWGSGDCVWWADGRRRMQVMSDPMCLFCCVCRI